MAAAGERCLVIVDAQGFRRAGIAALLHPLAETLGVSTVGLGPDDIDKPLAKAVVPVFVVLSVGGTSLHTPDISRCAADLVRVFPDVPCLVLSDLDTPDEAIAAANLGQQAFLSTCIEPSVALQICAFVIGGGTYFPRNALMARTRRPEAVQPVLEGNEELSPRQLQVLDKLRHGVSNKQIARDLTLQESTVKVHVREIMRKLGAHNRTQAALLGTRMNGAAMQSPVRAMSTAGMLPTSLFSAAYLDQDALPSQRSSNSLPLGSA